MKLFISVLMIFCVRASFAANNRIDVLRGLGKAVVNLKRQGADVKIGSLLLPDQVLRELTDQQKAQLIEMMKSPKLSADYLMNKELGERSYAFVRAATYGLGVGNSKMDPADTLVHLVSHIWSEEGLSRQGWVSTYGKQKIAQLFKSLRGVEDSGGFLVQETYLMQTVIVGMTDPRSITRISTLVNQPNAASAAALKDIFGEMLEGYGWVLGDRGHIMGIVDSNRFRGAYALLSARSGHWRIVDQDNIGGRILVDMIRDELAPQRLHVKNFLDNPTSIRNWFDAVYVSRPGYDSAQTLYKALDILLTKEAAEQMDKSVLEPFLEAAKTSSELEEALDVTLRAIQSGIAPQRSIAEPVSVY